MKIYKYEIPPRKQFDLEVPAHNRLLDVQFQDGTLFAWVLLLDEEKESPKENIRFYIFGTGEEFEIPLFASYLKTVQSGYFVWHIFINVMCNKEPAQ